MLTTLYHAQNDHRWVTFIARGPVRKDVAHRLQVHGLEIDLGFYFNAPVRVEFRSAAAPAAALAARRVPSPKLIKNVSNPKRQDPKNLPNISEFGGYHFANLIDTMEQILVEPQGQQKRYCRNCAKNWQLPC